MTKTVTPEELGQAIMQDLLGLHQYIGIESSKRIIQRAPSESGALRASIRAAVDAEDIQYNKDVTDQSGTSTQAENEAAIKSGGNKPDNVINIIVGAPYGQKMEEGDSSQAPTGFVKTVGEELNTIVKAYNSN